jgi:hypothetical protein
MQSLVLLLFVVGIILLTTGYQKKMLEDTLSSSNEKIIEYRFIPRSIYDEQLGQPTTSASFEDMFKRQNIFTSNYGI